MKDFDAQIKLLEDKLTPLSTQRAVLNTEIGRLMEQVSKLKAEKEAYQMSLPMTKEEEIKYFLFEDGSVTGPRYKARNMYWEGKGIHHSGYFPEINQIQLQICLYEGDRDNLDSTYNTLQEVIPFLKLQNGVKQLKVFEHTLSEDGSYVVEISDDSFDLVVWRYRSKSVVKSFDNLRPLLQYIQKYHYYESSYVSDEE